MAGQNSASSSSQRPVRVDASQAVAKICTGCNMDVGAMPRVKDEAGRYWCKPCLARAEEAARASQTAPDETRFGDDGGGFDGVDLAAAAAVEARAEAAQIDLPKEIRCPGCKGELPKEVRICIRCGYDKTRRSQLATKVEKVREKSTERPSRVSSGETPVGLGIGLGLASMAGAGLMFAGDPTLLLVGFLAVAALGVAAFICVVVAQFQSGDTGWGIASVVGLVLPLVGLSTLYWGLVKCSSPWIRWFYGLNVLGSIGLVVALFSGRLEGVVNL